MTAHQQEWQSWLHDPRHWDSFYNRVGMKTYAAIGREILSGRSPAEAVDRAVDLLCGQMRDSALPEEVITAYRDEYLRHRVHLDEIAQEIAATVPLHGSQHETGEHRPKRPKSAGPGDRAAPGCPDTVMEPFLWLAQLQSSLLLEYLQAATVGLRVMAHEIDIWSRLIASHPEHRRHAAHFRSSDLMHHYGRRTHDVDVEQL